MDALKVDLKGGAWCNQLKIEAFFPKNATTFVKRKLTFKK